MADKLERVAKAVARGCYEELVDKSHLTKEQYVERYWHMFKRAAECAIDELEAV